MVSRLGWISLFAAVMAILTAPAWLHAAGPCPDPPKPFRAVCPDPPLPEYRKCSGGSCVTEGCRCADESKCGTPQGACRKASPAPLPPPVVSYRQPVGHTHTCTSCGQSWDHSMDSHSHKCPFCGGYPPRSPGGGFYADPSPRLIKVQVQKVQAQRAVASPVISFGIPGCATGNCNRR